MTHCRAWPFLAFVHTRSRVNEKPRSRFIRANVGRECGQREDSRYCGAKASASYLSIGSLRIVLEIKCHGLETPARVLPRGGTVGDEWRSCPMRSRVGSMARLLLWMRLSVG